MIYIYIVYFCCYFLLLYIYFEEIKLIINNNKILFYIYKIRFYIFCNEKITLNYLYFLKRNLKKSGHKHFNFIRII